jgi:hypothetical protein
MSDGGSPEWEDPRWRLRRSQPRMVSTSDGGCTSWNRNLHFLEQAAPAIIQPNTGSIVIKRLYMQGIDSPQGSPQPQFGCQGHRLSVGEEQLPHLGVIANLDTSDWLLARTAVDYGTAGRACAQGGKALERLEHLSRKGGCGLVTVEREERLDAAVVRRLQGFYHHEILVHAPD